MRALLLVLPIALTVFGPSSLGIPPTPIRHEPIPQPDRLVAARVDTPVLVFEEGDDPDALPASIRVGERTLVAPPTALAGTGEDLLYRTAAAGVAPAAGTLQNLEGAFRPDRQTEREPWLTYHAVFDPDPIPFKRNQAKDRVRPDGALIVADPSVRPIDLAGNSVRPGRQVFYGSVLLEVQADVPVPLPSISPESHILSYATVPATTLTFGKDAADNFYVTSTGSQGRVRLNFVMDAPDHWFEHSPPADLAFDEVPAELLPTLPATQQPAVTRVLEAIGVTEADTYSAALAKLVYWFRDFETGKLPSETDNLYLDLALGKKGVCRHRAYAFVITAQGLGIPARYVTNEAHTFAEVYIPRSGWLRIDLGGGAQGMNVRNSGEKARHTVDADKDPFGFPPAFRSGYSQRASGNRTGPGGRGDDEVRGLPPASEAGSSTGDPTGDEGGEPTGEEPAEPGPRVPQRAPIAKPYRAPRGDRRAPSEVILEGAVARVFRGDQLTLTGHVLSKGEPVVGGRVRLSLLDPARQHVLFILGKDETGEAGDFHFTVPIPPEAELGAWELVAEFEGDLLHAPALSD